MKLEVLDLLERVLDSQGSKLLQVGVPVRQNSALIRLVSVVSIEDLHTPKSDKQKKKAIDRVFDGLVKSAKAAGQAT